MLKLSKKDIQTIVGMFARHKEATTLEIATEEDGSLSTKLLKIHMVKEEGEFKERRILLMKERLNMEVGA